MEAPVAAGEGGVAASLFALGSAIAQETNVSLASHCGLRFLPLPDTPEARAAMHKVFSSAHTQVCQPSPAFVGVIASTRLMAEASTVPYHPGAEKFYRETGEWPPKRR